MSQKVTPIFEGSLTYEREVNEELVEDIEALLEKVRSGEVVGVVYAELYHDGLAGNGFCGKASNALIGALERAKYRIFSDL